MADKSLLSVGLDVGTTTTQLIVSRLQVQNEAASFTVPKMQITGREILYRSQVHFTPLLGKDLVDAEAVRRIVEAEYQKAGITPAQVDSGAVIITGETSRKENARAVLAALAEFAGDFVVATAGPDLESVLAAKGAGAVEFSRQTGKPVLHIDIGGGTSNFSWIEKGKVVRTGCMNVGGRLLKFEPGGKVSYVSPVLEGLTDLQVGDDPMPSQVEDIAKILVHGLEMAAGLREPTELLEKLWTKEADCHGLQGKPRNDRNDTSSVSFADSFSSRRSLGGREIPPAASQPPPFRQGGLGEEGFKIGQWVISFSGGVADCIEGQRRTGEFGDMGVELGQAIRESLLCQGDYMLGTETIRATVIGAGCHSMQLSGSTVFCRGVSLPVKNLPVAVFSREEQDREDFGKVIAESLSRYDDRAVVLHLPGQVKGYEDLVSLGEKILQGLGDRPAYLCLEEDVAKALGQVLCLRLPEETPCLCLDRVQLTEDSFLDVGEPVGPAFPVVVKTLVLQGM